MTAEAPELPPTPPRWSTQKEVLAGGVRPPTWVLEMRFEDLWDHFHMVSSECVLVQCWVAGVRDDATSGTKSVGLMIGAVPVVVWGPWSSLRTFRNRDEWLEHFVRPVGGGRRTFHGAGPTRVMLEEGTSLIVAFERSDEPAAEERS